MRTALTVFCTLLSFIIASRGAFAGSFTIYQAGRGLISSLHGEAAAPKIGSFIEPGMLITFDDDAINIQQSKPDGSRTTILSGVVFNMHVQNDLENAPRIKGYCFFTSGAKLPKLLGTTSDVTDLILLIDNQRFAGTITSVDKDLLSLKDKTATHLIRTSQIKAVVSSRVFNLSALAFSASDIKIGDKSNFNAKILRFELDQTLDDFMTISGRNRMDAAVSARGYTKLQRTALVGGAALVTAAAIAAPLALAVPLTGRHRFKENPPPPDDIHVIQR